MIKIFTYVLVFVAVQSASLFSSFRDKTQVAQNISEINFLTLLERVEHVEARKELFMTSLFENNVKRRILMHGLRPLIMDNIILCMTQQTQPEGLLNGFKHDELLSLALACQRKINPEMGVITK